ncbi:hypothetical protein MTX26_33850 [Bradyrhizobium sp. ISRA443]|uniref:hypothetical protein n=1 Tax=unclassified Bradyrhizobium TaxID=2631580 RepID=UPI002478CE46|nr:MULTISPECIES: hypothetical protein [unclassified Bradyrhizobium]WGR94391.1 hypothetical protein MTX20_08950 [Bradyrhizobium sp. ISRA435]WGR99110.1 hypothetical protein MTX23_33830 [Bradyrhizobium sp. ISRA436]WGS06001.1 hypothetical protein MTX18_33850 [Bradyrhizobium sp. ISRA437]WGS12887.1 hypothetical protein MTX26_33850 [Bradyrhizobium sp. ISRA443]
MQVRASETRGRLVPALAAAAVAVLATAALFLLEFNPPRNVSVGDPGMITTAAANRAGAIVLPTDPETTGSVR